MDSSIWKNKDLYSRKVIKCLLSRYLGTKLLERKGDASIFLERKGDASIFLDKHKIQCYPTNTMPRIFRILPEQGIFHILTRGNNRQAVFLDKEDYAIYFNILKRYKEEHEFLLYHYCLMPNHIHLILEVTLKTNLSKFMKQLNLAYLYHFRRKYSYYGHLWQGRFKSILIEKDRYLISCGKYIELNPVKAKMVKDPKDYPWTSYRVYAYGEENALLDFDPLYQDLGRTDTERRKRYRNSITEEVLNLNARFLGKDSFIKEMEKSFEVKNLKGKRGRPKKIK